MRNALQLRIDACIALCLTAATVLVYWPGLFGGFLFDDYPNLVLAQEWKVHGLRLEGWRAAADAGISGSAGRPFAMLSFAINHALTGMDPFWLKLTSVLMHAFNGFLVFQLCRSLFRSVPWPSGNARPSRLAASVVAAVWLLHPLQVSTVLYVVQRMEIGAATGTLLALLAYCRCRHLQVDGKRGGRWLWAALAAMALGCGFKESAALTPLFAFLLEICVFRFVASDRRVSRYLVASYALLATVSTCLFLAYVLPVMGGDAAYSGRSFNLTERLLTQMPVLLMYVHQALIPSLESMTFYYDNFPVSRGLLAPASTGLALAVLVALAVIATASWRRWPLVTLGIGWFFGGHALTSNVIPLELAFEHRNYLALLGLALALVTPLHLFGMRMSLESRLVAAILPVLGLATLCALQAATWGKPFQLAWTLENRNPDSPRANYALGKAMLERAYNMPSSPNWTLARKQFLRTESLSSPSPLAIQAVLLMDAQSHRRIDPELWRALRSALQHRPFDAESLGSLHALVQCRIQLRCDFNDDEILDTFVTLLETNGSNPALLTVYADFAWNVLGDEDLALRAQRTAVSAAPGVPAYAQALSKFERAVRRERATPAGSRTPR